MKKEDVVANGDGEKPTRGKRKNRRGKGINKIQTHTVDGKLTAACDCGCGHISHTPAELGIRAQKRESNNDRLPLASRMPEQHFHMALERGGACAPTRFQAKNAMKKALHALE